MARAGLAIHGLRAAKQQFALVLFLFLFLFLFHGAMGQSRIL
jgi:hypothetical protein